MPPIGYAYLATPLIALIFASILHHHLQKYRPPPAIFLGIALLISGLAFRSHNIIPRYQNSLILFGPEIQRTPRSVIAHVQYAAALAEDN